MHSAHPSNILFALSDSGFDVSSQAEQHQQQMTAHSEAARGVKLPATPWLPAEEDSYPSSPMRRRI
jgi:hypothetical protein